MASFQRGLRSCLEKVVAIKVLRTHLSFLHRLILRPPQLLGLSLPTQIRPHFSFQQGLLEMIHQKMNDWVLEFVSDIRQMKPQLNLPSPGRPSSQHRKELHRRKELQRMKGLQLEDVMFIMQVRVAC